MSDLRSIPCNESRTIKGEQFHCWHRYEPEHGWKDEPHEHWFTTLDDNGHKIRVTWTTPTEEQVSVYAHHAEGCTFNEGGNMQWVCVDSCPSRTALEGNREGETS